MPNYILSRTSPPAHIYERKINLGYGIKVDTSDAPANQAQKGKEMQDAKEVLDVADIKVNPVDGQPVTVADASVVPLVGGQRIRADIEAQEAEGESNDGLAFNGV